MTKIGFIVCVLLFPLIAGQSRLSVTRLENFNPQKVLKVQKIRTAEKCGLLEEANRLGRCELITALAVESVVALAGDIADVRVFGAINGEETFGVTIMLEILSRAGNEGDVWFTDSQDDILQIGDPWLDIGVFSSYDTDSAASDYLNGSVDDDGDYLFVSAVYAGSLSLFPVEISADARGVWDISLSTVAGDSDWEGVQTVLRHGTITITD